jgi:hypothetical protein
LAFERLQFRNVGTFFEQQLIVQFDFLGGFAAEFGPRTMRSLSNAFTSVVKSLDPIPFFQATAKIGKLLHTKN